MQIHMFVYWLAVKSCTNDMMYLHFFTVYLCDWNGANHRWRMETLIKLLQARCDSSGDLIFLVEAQIKCTKSELNHLYDFAYC